jgi:membrane fusion protein, copper/silver efflux system
MKIDMRQVRIVFYFLSLAVLTGCKTDHQAHQETSDSYYTCPMHPSVVSTTPGSCPVCNMSLIRVEKTQTDQGHGVGNFITLDTRQQELAGIKVDTVAMRNFSSASTILGTVAINEEQVKTISSRVKGRIEKLYVKSSGTTIKAGSPLYSIYSEQLQADEKEYLSLLENVKRSDAASQLVQDLLDASKKKLLLWGLSENQISDLEKSGTASPLFTFYSSLPGYVTKVPVTEGMYVQEGSALFEITALNEVWVEAQVYSHEVSAAPGKTFKIYSERNPDHGFKGTLVYFSPLVEEGKRVNLLRIRVANPGSQLIPGTLVSVVPDNGAAFRLAVPRSAVLLEKMKTVWVLAHDNTFEQRMVNTGAESSQWVEIVSGLQKGELVVTEGAYLISSEYTLKSGAGQKHDH